MSSSELDLETIQFFCEELSEIINDLESDFLILETQLAHPDEELVNKIFRGLHSIKGNAGFMGLSAIKKLAHAMEDVFSAVREKTITLNRDQLDHLLLGNDRLKDMEADLVESENVDTDDLVNKYQEILAGQKTVDDSLIEALRSADDMIHQIEVLQAIAEGKDTSLIEPLLQFVAQPFPDEAVNVIVNDTLRELISVNPVTLGNVLKHTSGKVLITAIAEVGEYKLRQFVPDLLRILHDDIDIELLCVTLRALGKIGDQTCYEHVKPYCIHEDVIIASTALEALEFISPDFKELFESFSTMDEVPALTMLELVTTQKNKKVINFLVNNIHHHSSVIRRLIASHLVRIGPDTSLPLAAKLVFGSRDEKIMAANILGTIKNSDIVPFLVVPTRDEDAAVRFAAYEALSNIGISHAINSCIKGLFDSDVMVRVLVLGYLEKISSAIVVGNIRRILSSDAHKRELFFAAMSQVVACSIIKRLEKYPDIIAPLIATIKQEGTDELREVYVKFFQQEGNEKFLNCWQATSVQERSVEKQDFKILIVDDSKAILNITRNILVKNGYTAFTAENGQLALDILAVEHIDIILTDLNMPVMNGIELSREVRGNSLFSTLPIVMITTEQKDQEKEVALSAGVNHFLTKPFGSDDLLEIVKKQLASSPKMV